MYTPAELMRGCVQSTGCRSHMPRWLRKHTHHQADTAKDRTHVPAARTRIQHRDALAVLLLGLMLPQDFVACVFGLCWHVAARLLEAAIALAVP